MHPHDPLDQTNKITIVNMNDVIKKQFKKDDGSK